MKVAICQTNIIWEEKEKNYEKAVQYITNASENKADIVFFPEMSFTGFSMEVNKTKEDNEYTVNVMRKHAVKEQIAVGFGWVKANGPKVENHYTVLDKSGNVLCDYIKIHSFRYGGEDKQFLQGNALKTFRLGDFVFAPLICYDLRFPEIFRKVMDVADVYVIPANWPEGRAEHWKTLLKARAIENQAYILGINCVGEMGGLFYSGDSSIISPDGMVVEYVSGKEEVLYSCLSKEALKIRESFPIRNDRRIELYSMQ